jgi:hypothetical protein
MKLKTTLTRVALASLMLRPLRTDPGSEEEMKALARSWLADPLHPILVRAADRAVGDGNRRVMGLLLLGETEADVELIDGEVSDRDLDRMAMVSSWHRAPLGGYDQANILRAMREAQPGATLKSLADELHIDPSMPGKLLAIFDCPPEVQDAARLGKIGVTHWLAIRRAADPLAALRAIAENGSSRADQERANRQKKRADSAQPAVRMPRIKCPLPSGQVVTVAGSGSLEDAIEALGEAIKAMKDALKRGVTARTFANEMKDITAG